MMKIIKSRPMRCQSSGAGRTIEGTTMATYLPNAKKTAFVTGASSGIGKAAAVALTQAGYRVIGTSRRAAPGEVRDGIRMIACDVTDDASVANAVALAHS